MSDDVEMLDNVEEGLTRMTVAIPMTHLDDIPLHMPRHIVGARSSFSVLLKKVAWVIVYYIDHHHHDYM